MTADPKTLGAREKATRRPSDSSVKRFECVSVIEALIILGYEQFICNSKYSQIVIRYFTVPNIDLKLVPYAQ